LLREGDPIKDAECGRVSGLPIVDKRGGLIEGYSGRRMNAHLNGRGCVQREVAKSILRERSSRLALALTRWRPDPLKSMPWGREGGVE
jgi:hypothetical protein